MLVSQNNNLMGRFGNVGGTFCVCWEGLNFQTAMLLQDQQNMLIQEHVLAKSWWP